MQATDAGLLPIWTFWGEHDRNYRRPDDPSARAEPDHVLPAPVLLAVCRLRDAYQRTRRRRPVRSPARR